MSKIVLDGYRDRESEYSGRLENCRRVSNRLSLANRFCLGGCAICFFGATSSFGPVWVWLAMGSISLFCAVAAGFFRQRYTSRRRRTRELELINHEAAARIERRWAEFPHLDVELSDEEQVSSEDLDLFGYASVFHLLWTGSTPAGTETLRDWILNPADPESVVERQLAVRTLAPQISYRQEARAHARVFSNSQASRSTPFHWSIDQDVFRQPGWLKWACRIIPMISVLSLSLVLLGIFPQEVCLPVMMTSLAVSLLISVFCIGPVHDLFREVSPDRDGLKLHHTQQLLHSLALMDAEPDVLKRISQTAKSAEQALQQLRRIMKPALLSRNPWTTVWVYLPLQILTLWDFHILGCLEKWVNQHSAEIDEWFLAIGEFEALESMASLAHDNPGWCFPVVDSENVGRLDANDLGHPLLPAKTRVVNDASIGPKGTLLLVTGSNMSGKSTLLRAIGLNAVLAQAGAPVCASNLTMPPLRIATSMRVTDSLKDGVSLFMAELLRLKRVVKLAEQTDSNTSETMLYLLDEVLQGTNTSERHIAIRTVLSHLLRQGVIGAVTTHDLMLADDPVIRDSAHVVHLREILHSDDGPGMTFDYKVRSGVAPTTNALKLLEIVGLKPVE